MKQECASFLVSLTIIMIYYRFFMMHIDKDHVLNKMVDTYINNACNYECESIEECELIEDVD